MKIKEFCELHCLTDSHVNDGELIDKDLFINDAVTFIPEGVKLNVNGNLYINNITTLKDVTISASGDVYLAKLLAIEDSVLDAKWVVAPILKYIKNSMIKAQMAYRDWETDRKSTRLNSSH